MRSATSGGYTFSMLDWKNSSAVERDPQKVSGSWVFRNTRVPVAALFLNLGNGARIDDFMQWFPGVTREQIEVVLTYAQKSLDNSQAA